MHLPLIPALLCLTSSQVPELSKLRYKLCPGVMKEEMFWRVYFLILQNKIGYIFSDEVVEEPESPPPPPSHTETTIPTDTPSNEQPAPTTTNDSEYSVKSKFAYDYDFNTPDRKRIQKSSNNNSPITPRATPQTPAEIEDYFDKIFIGTPATTPIDEGIEPDYDSYFSPRKLSYEIES